MDRASQRQWVEARLEFGWDEKAKYSCLASTCLVMIDRNSYSVACAVAGKLIQCRLYADRLVTHCCDIIETGNDSWRIKKRT